MFFILIVSGSAAQDSVSLRKHYLKVYRQALSYTDANAAINALQNYIAMDNSKACKNTLSMLYCNIKSFYSSLLLSEEVYKADPENIYAMERAAECYDELGDPKTAVSLFEIVAPKTKNPYHIYKLAICQYQLKSVAECESSANKVRADTTAKNVGVLFTKADGSQQTVPVHAAAANLLGVLKMGAKNYAGAKADFQMAINFSGILRERKRTWMFVKRI